MDQNLSLLAAQAIPVICERLGVRCSLPKEILPISIDGKGRLTLEEARNRLLAELFSRHGISWWDVFDSSDIGRERDLIARRYIRTRSEVTDVGCGRGYFAFACARRSSRVVGVDTMNGNPREGWWDAFLTSRGNLGLNGRVHAARADAVFLPFKDLTFDVATCIHAIRNFSNVNYIKRSFREMYRVVRKGGRVVVAESLVDVKSRSQAAYSAFYELRIQLGWETRLPTQRQLVSWLRGAGFVKIEADRIEAPFDYAPVVFPKELVQRRMARQRRVYLAARKLWEAGRIASPPVLVVSGRKEA